MSDNANGFSPVPLAAGSYDVDELKSALASANEEKPEDRAAVIAAAVSQVEAVGVGGEKSDVAIPEGHVLADVEDAQGRTVKAAVADPDLIDDEGEKKASSKSETKAS